MAKRLHIKGSQFEFESDFCFDIYFKAQSIQNSETHWSVITQQKKCQSKRVGFLLLKQLPSVKSAVNLCGSNLEEGFLASNESHGFDKRLFLLLPGAFCSCQPLSWDSRIQRTKQQEVLMSIYTLCTNLKCHSRFREVQIPLSRMCYFFDDLNESNMTRPSPCHSLHIFGAKNPLFRVSVSMEKTTTTNLWWFRVSDPGLPIPLQHASEMCSCFLRRTIIALQKP